MDVRRVPRKVLSPVVQHRDGRPSVGVGWHRTLEQSPLRGRDGTLEAVAGQQDGVGQERVEVGEVVRPALGEVVVRVGGNTGCNRGQRHQVRIR